MTGAMWPGWYPAAYLEVNVLCGSKPRARAERSDRKPRGQTRVRQTPRKARTFPTGGGDAADGTDRQPREYDDGLPAGHGEQRRGGYR